MKPLSAPGVATPRDGQIHGHPVAHQATAEHRTIALGTGLGADRGAHLGAVAGRVACGGLDLTCRDAVATWSETPGTEFRL